ncbi:MAG: aspartyl protease family protein [Bryobacteraceae bacterium]|jgi:aspartyl protease/PDZ domain-containing protein
MRISGLITRVLWLALGGCALAGPAEYSIACEPVGGLVYIEVRINGSDPTPFVLDTGASVSIISPSAAQRLKLVTGDSIQAAGPGRGGSETMPIASGVSVGIGPIELKNQSMAVLSVDYIATQAGHATDGILSVGAFAPQVVEVDYGAKRIRFLDASTFTPVAGSVEVPVTLNGNVPYVRAEIGLPGGGTAGGRFVLDSGLARGAVLFSKPFIERYPELLQTGERIDLPLVEAVGGKMEMKAGRIAFLRMAPFTFAEPIAVFTLDGTGVLDDPHIDGIIGTAILERFRVAYDYAHSRIFLTPEIPADRPFRGDLSGLQLVTVPPDFHRFVVRGVVKHSAAEDAGLRGGDVLLAIDGKRAAELTLTQIREMFESGDREYGLAIERGTQKLTVGLKMRRLI